MTTFAQWLLAQADKSDWIGDVARAARRDARFPKAGEPIDVLDHVTGRLGDEAEPYQAILAAADEWHGGHYPWAVKRDERRRAAVQVELDAFEAKLRAEEAAKRAKRNAQARARRAAS